MEGKNIGMGKTIDKVALTLLLSVLAFLLCYRLTDSVYISTAAALLLVVAVNLLLSFLHPRTPKNRLSKRNFIRYVLLKGNGELKRIVSSSFSVTLQATDVGEHTMLVCGENRILVYYAYKFGSLSEEDVAKSYRIAELQGCQEIYALTNHLDRKTLAVAEYIPQRFTVINAGTLYKYLSRRGLVPKKEALPKKNGKAFRFFNFALKAEHTKYYIWAGLTTALLALFTPITTYYIVFAFINLALATATIFLSEKGDGRDRLFKE